MKTTHTIYSRQAGLTLIEIMVAMVISLILMAGVLQIFQANKQSFVVQESLSLIQENGRTAIRLLADDLRMADFWGCRSRDIQVTNNLNAGGTGFIDYLANGGITGTNGTGTNPDTITIEGARSAGIRVSAAMLNVTAALPVTNGASLAQNDILLVTDCVQGDIIQVTNASPAGTNTVAHNAGAGNPGNNTANLTRVYNPGAMVFQARQTTYSIRVGASGAPSLFRAENGNAAVELVEGIQDMQIQYGELLSTISNAMRYVDAGTAGLNMNQVRSVRITLIARSNATNVALGGDGRLRRTFSNTISIRNRNP